MNPELKPGTQITTSPKDSKLGFVSLLNRSLVKANTGVSAGVGCEDGCDRSCFDPCDRDPIGDPCDRDPIGEPCDEGPSCFDPSTTDR